MESSGAPSDLYPLEIIGYSFLGSRLTGWKDKVWSRRYESILVTEEDAAQVERLRYLLENSCKEGLVDSSIHWPGVHCAKALITGDRVEGTWFDRKLEHNARLRGKEPEPREFASPEEVVLSQLPCWRHLSPEGLAPIPYQ